MTCFVDAPQASNKLTYRSHTGIFIMLNSAPIVWYFVEAEYCRDEYFWIGICCFAYCNGVGAGLGNTFGWAYIDVL